jgi:phage-related protein
MKKIRGKMPGVAVAAVLLAFGVNEARAQSLGDVGKSFASDLADKASACKSKITGIRLDVVKATFGCLVAAVKEAARAAILNLVRALYDQAVTLMKDNAPKAKEMLTTLGDKVGSFVPAVKDFIKPVVDGLVGAGGDKLVSEAAKCKANIKALDVPSLQATFSCLATAVTTALKGAGVAVVQGLFEVFIQKLRQGCASGAQALGNLVGKLKSLVPAAGAVIDQVTGFIQTGCNGAVDKLANVKIPGL